MLKIFTILAIVFICEQLFVDSCELGLTQLRNKATLEIITCVPPVEGHADPCIVKTGGRMSFCQSDRLGEYVCCGTQELLVQLLADKAFSVGDVNKQITRQFSQRSTKHSYNSIHEGVNIGYSNYANYANIPLKTSSSPPYITMLTTPMMFPGNFTNSLRISANVIAIRDGACTIIVNTGMPHQKPDIIKNLARYGISAHHVKYVVVTSAQPQFVGNLNLFPNAQVIFEKHFVYKENLIKGGIEQEVHVELCSSQTYIISTPGPTENSVTVVASNVPSLGKVAIVGSLFPYDDSIYRMDSNFVANSQQTVGSRMSITCQVDWIIPGLHSAFPVTHAMKKLAQC